MIPSMEHLTCEQRQRHAIIYSWLYQSASQLPTNSREYATAEMLSNLALSLLDSAVLRIIAYLKIQQLTFEKELWKDRKSKIKKMNEKRNMFEISTLKRFEEGQINKREKKALLKKMKYDYESKVKSIDMKIYQQIEKLMRKQQEKLEKAAVPGFFITQDSNISTLQIHLLKCITDTKAPFEIDAIMKETRT